MAYTTPRTYVAGEVHTAAHHNTYERDNIAWIATDSCACRVFNSANISIPNTTDTVVTFDSERFDNAAMHSTSSNTSRITIPSGGDGKYLYGVLAEFTSNATGDRGNHIKLNGTTYITKSVAKAPTNNWSDTETSSYAMSAADYVENFVFQSSGGALNLLASGNYSPEMWAYWLRN